MNSSNAHDRPAYRFSQTTIWASNELTMGPKRKPAAGLTRRAAAVVLAGLEDRLGDTTWRASAILGVRRVRQAAEYYRDVLGFSLDPEDGVFQPSPDEPDGVYAIVTRSSARIHFQIRRGEIPERSRSAIERGRLPVCDGRGRTARRVQTSRGDAQAAPADGTVRDSRAGGQGLNGFRLVFGEFSE